MSQEEELITPSAETAARLGADIIIATLALRIIIADLAKQGRSAEQAGEYVESMRRNMESFISLTEKMDGAYSKIITAEMRSYAEKLLAGIKFESK